ncbi:type II toxin-antitoxin system TacA family antitoxin [Mangrovibrevibacter kandeliae]|uniref:type II toxin-antitoxin system TacA family antitoxin n=1 Tax=Mangrovibrevibacter kandeliae TaxID=2968473 RepID=UPI002118A40D|nr:MULTISPECIES: DUF1778 domain-containing protein [unclassified Aurantimonas]MCQ8783674.1 DUF1778 domain-containing protein [Aurantimonas sp. CSK15Z-1]MCW4116364.1 DUF1778 domain-containing protein [Aurantimonas sp. MSK8Z-1]
MALAKKKDNFTARIAPDDLELIKRAAETCGKSLSAFVIEAATFSAQKALMDQRFLHLDAELFDSLSETISQPAQVHPELAELLRNGSQWATSER